MAEAARLLQLELLAPAGNREKLEMALRYGADAVYLSASQFGLRASSATFSQADLADAIALVHRHKRRAYLTLNILAHPGDLSDLNRQLDNLLATGPDAVIVSDAGIFSLIRARQPDQAIHISTQASITNEAACSFWHRQGAKRIVLARELTLGEIAHIRQHTPPQLELEGFVHGAMCVAYSGRCLLSADLTGRDANRGQCAQPCRWAYELVESQNPGHRLSLEADARGSYLLSSRDLCLIDHLPELVQAGLSSFKIEGRMKSAYYVATVVGTYRKALDTYLADPAGWAVDPGWRRDLEKTNHRPFGTGFAFQTPGQQANLSRHKREERSATVVGVVKAWLPGRHLALVEQRNRLSTGQDLEIMQPDGSSQAIVSATLFDLEGQPLACAPHPNMYFFLKTEAPVQADAFIRRLDTQPTGSSG